MARYTLTLLLAALPLTPAAAQTPDQKKITVEYLRSLQSSEGGFYTARPQPGAPTGARPDVRATSSGLRALKYFGGEPRDREAAARFVRSCLDQASGGFAPQPGGKPDVATTAVGAMAAVELKLPPRAFEDGVVHYLAGHARTFEEIRIAVAGLEALGKPTTRAAEWQKQLEALRNPDGTYGKDEDPARGTGGVVVALMRLGVKVENPAAVLQILRKNQRSDGGFGKAGAAGSDLETTYRVMRCFYMLKEKPADPEAIRNYVARCRNADGGYGTAPGQGSTISGTYYAGILLHWLDAR